MLMPDPNRLTLAVLETRFGDVPYPLREAVTAMDDLARLKQWHRLAIQLRSLDEFQTHLHLPEKQKAES